MAPDEVQLLIGVVDLRQGLVRTHQGDAIRLTSRERRLLVRLAGTPGRVHPRDELLAEVWGYSGAVVSRAVDDTVKRLRRKIEEDPGRPVHLLTEHGVGFRFEPLAVDAPPPAAAAPSTPRALELDGGWVDLARGRVHRAWGASEHLTSSEAAVLSALASSPGRTVRRSDLARAQGRGIENAVRRLRQKLGPDAIRTIRGVGYQLAGPSPGSAAGGPPRTNVAPALQPLLGRDRELVALDALADRRLITIVGPGGVGKTRLLREHGLEIAPTLSGGAWFCDLVGVTGRSGLAAAVARALGEPIRPADRQDLSTAIGDALARRGPTLLLLDNLEQLPTSELDPLLAWLSSSPRLRLIATSRRELGLPDEHVLRLGPLDPDPAIELYEARACGRWTRIPDRGEVRALVEALDGLPLAIELAAARAAILGPTGVRERLRDGLDVLASPHAPERHRALEATLQWSWRFLDRPARSLLARCSAFRGPFSLAMAEAVVEPADRGRVLEALQVLFEHSVVHTTPGEGGEARFAMLSMVRQFAAERLDEADRTTVARRHARWFLAEAHLHKMDLAWQLRHREDLVAAVEHALADPELADEAARLVLALVKLLGHGPVDEHLRLLDRAMERSALPALELQRHAIARMVGIDVPEDALARLRDRPDVDEETAIRAQLQIANLRGHRDPASSLEASAVALDRARRFDEPRLMAQCALELGARQIALGRFAEAEPTLAESLALYERARDLTGASQALRSLGEIALLTRRLSDASAFFERAWRTATRCGDRYAESTSLLQLATVSHVRGAPEEALALAARARPALEQSGRPVSLCSLHLIEGRAAQELGDLERAEVLLDHAAALLPASRSGWQRLWIAAHRAVLCGQTGRPAEGEVRLEGLPAEPEVELARAYLRWRRDLAERPRVGQEGAPPRPSFRILARLVAALCRTP